MKDLGHSCPRQDLRQRPKDPPSVFRDLESPKSVLPTFQAQLHSAIAAPLPSVPCRGHDCPRSFTFLRSKKSPSFRKVKRYRATLPSSSLRKLPERVLAQEGNTAVAGRGHRPHGKIAGAGTTRAQDARAGQRPAGWTRSARGARAIGATMKVYSAIASKSSSARQNGTQP